MKAPQLDADYLSALSSSAMEDANEWHSESETGMILRECAVALTAAKHEIVKQRSLLDKLICEETQHDES